MTKNEIFEAANFDITGEENVFVIPMGRFSQWLHEGYEIVMNKMKEMQPNSFMSAATALAIVKDTTESFALAADFESVDRVEYTNDAGDIVKIPPTLFDEQNPYQQDDGKLRWYVSNGSIYFRGVSEDIDARMYYIKLITPMNNLFDVPEFPKHHSMLVEYVKAKYYKTGKFENSGDTELQEFYRLLKELEMSSRNIREPKKVRMYIENGVD